MFLGKESYRCAGKTPIIIGITTHGDFETVFPPGKKSEQGTGDTGESIPCSRKTRSSAGLLKRPE